MGLPALKREALSILNERRTTMGTEQLKKVLAGLGIATLLAGAGLAGTGCTTAEKKPGATG